MTRNIKKTDRDKSWNRRPGHAKVYALKSRETNSKKFLIICEGENTEPCYFKSFPVATASVEAFGLGSSKTSLVKQAIDFVSQEDADPEREVWIVFDMDFDHLKDKSLQKKDFNEAIRLANEKGYKVAYSNDAFELWFVLYYQLIESALNRSEYYKRISQYWGKSYERYGKERQFCRGVYQRLKNDPKADEMAAIRNAERLFIQQMDKAPADQNPCTTVYQLVVELNKFLRR